MLYEINYLVLQSKADDLLVVRKTVKEMVVSLGGRIKEEKEFLKRRLAYEINNEGYGFHTVLRFETENPQECIEQIKKKLNLSSKVTRYIIVKADGMLPLKELFVKEKEQESQYRKQRDTIKQEDVNKFLTDKKREDRLSAAKTPQKNIEIEDEKERESVKEGGRVIEDKKERAETEEEDKEKISLDDLDEKLDEILNI